MLGAQATMSRALAYASEANRATTCSQINVAKGTMLRMCAIICPIFPLPRVETF